MLSRVAARSLVGAAGSFTSSGGTALRAAVAARQAGSLTPYLQQQQTRTFFSKERSKSAYEHGAHRSDAEARIAEMPVVLVDGPVALCDGGGGALGHPLDYIQLDNPDGGPRACQYCGLRYQMKKHYIAGAKGLEVSATG